MPIRNALYLAGLTLVSALATAPLVADATTNYSTYPASTCYYSTASTSGIKYNGGSLYNSSTTATLNIECPIIRDETSGTTISATAYASTYSSSYTVSCKLYDYSMTSSSGYSGTAKTTSSSGYQSLSLSATTASGYREYLLCALSKSKATTSFANETYLLGYYVTES